MNFAWAAAIGGLTAFIVKFLKGPAGLASDQIMFAASAKFVGGLLTLWFLATRLDRMGSRPIMFLSLGLWIFILVGWAAMAGGGLSASFPVVLGLYLAMGFAFSMFGMALTRLTMATVPRMGRSHFFAMYSVVGSLAVGVFPILWGILIDALAAVDIFWMGLNWNQYSIYFTALLVVMGVVAVLVMRLEEKKAVRVNDLLRDLIRNNPLRGWLRR